MLGAKGMEAMVNTRDEILKHLNAIQSHYAAYHNHKETAAWAGLVLSLFFQWNVAGAVAKAGPMSCELRTTVIVAELFVIVLTWVFLRKQFTLRRRGGDIAGACIALASEIVGNPSGSFDAAEYLPNDIHDTEFQSSNVLPARVLRRANELSAGGQGARQTLEWLAYGLLSVSGALSVAWVWLVRAT